MVRILKRCNLGWGWIRREPTPVHGTRSFISVYLSAINQTRSCRAAAVQERVVKITDVEDHLTENFSRIAVKRVGEDLMRVHAHNVKLDRGVRKINCAICHWRH